MRPSAARTLGGRFQTRECGPSSSSRRAVPRAICSTKSAPVVEAAGGCRTLSLRSVRSGSRQLAAAAYGLLSSMQMARRDLGARRQRVGWGRALVANQPANRRPAARRLERSCCGKAANEDRDAAAPCTPKKVRRSCPIGDETSTSTHDAPHQTSHHTGER